MLRTIHMPTAQKQIRFMEIRGSSNTGVNEL
jgi:hypothetical protein